MAASAGRTLELAEILRVHAPPLEALGPQRRRAVRDIINCRTAALGGRLQVCDRCGKATPLYNSCRNRHCPKCQSLEQARWVEAQTRDLLPVPYFHVVFTVPASLHPFFLSDRRVGFRLLFAAAQEALHGVCRERLGVVPGTIAILHTWTQTLIFHPHIHCVVTGGGLDRTEQRWISSRSNFLVPVRVLSRVFRARLLSRLSAAIADGSLRPRGTSGRRLLGAAASREWVVYSKPPMAGPEQVLRYLGRYTHRIAITNRRIVSVVNGCVTFRYRDRKRGDRQRLMTLQAPDFIRRFLVHVLPRSFVRIRHFGLLANAWRTKRLARARQLLGAPSAPERERAARPSWRELYGRLTGGDPDLCPSCRRGRLRVVSVIESDFGAVACARAP